jgi:hypothetical protein
MNNLLLGGKNGRGACNAATATGGFLELTRLAGRYRQLLIAIGGIVVPTVPSAQSVDGSIETCLDNLPFD